MDRRDIAARAAELAGVDPAQVTVRDVSYAWGSPGTGGLWTVSAPAARFGPVEYFVKLLRHPRLWPGLVHVPEPFRDGFLQQFPWRFEYDMQRSGIATVLPPGMRTPTLHHVHRPDADHLLLWWERIHERPGRWSREEYVRAAFLLGRLAARRRDGAMINSALPALCHRERGSALRYLVESRVMVGALGELGGAALWSHPAVAATLDRLGEPGLRTELLELGQQLGDLLDAVERVPMTYAHGDASPQNLLIDERAPDTFVVIDWGLGSLLPVGFDLGQLLVGPVHAGLVDPDEIPAIDALVVDPYVDGLARDGLRLDRDVIRIGYHACLALRSALTTLSLQDLAGRTAEETDRFVDQRVRMARQLVDLTADAVARCLSARTPVTVGRHRP
jgi:hypothetical protein